MLEEKLRDRGGEKALFHGDADLARLLDIERQHGDMIALGLEHQAVDDAHTESRFDHGKEGEIACCIIGDLRVDIALVEQAVEFVVFDLHQAHEVLVRQLLEREDGRVRHRVILREDGDHRVVQDGRRLKVVGGGDGKKAAVDRAAAQPFGNFIILASHQLDLNVGVRLVEVLQNFRQQADGKACKAPEAQRAGLHAMQLGHGKVEVLIVLDDLADRGQEHHAV